ncbi:methylated-DNA--[protein]-cysteine S-methyltransferase [Sphingomonas colocasiae]|uniref:Methylated-DNA--[protein]-cysteine S-methyltransferase n=1 Tax=Sphingomonas colocasiae TaxID=1848973 RepID=A0ABS7PQJ9_9SPHN|nr:methylated-DNA--[protein]-cysteine S-methyltransferase [Sphingomonas colocasiae]MBY8822990.1 methylated-DNA--[protein]-cysteine S-methyltransferase [Sphingomonas colocasiae]
MARKHHYRLFETRVGFAAIAWNATGISSLRLPAPTASETERSMARRLPDAAPGEPSADVQAVIDAAIRYFEGDRVDFSAVAVDLGEQDPFFARVYDRVRTLGWGETTTYGAIAQSLGVGPEYARDVGQAMAKNPVPLIVPCHRVTAAGGRIGGFSAPGGAMSKARMLELEGVATGAPVENPAQQGFNF